MPSVCPRIRGLSLSALRKALEIMGAVAVDGLFDSEGKEVQFLLTDQASDVHDALSRTTETTIVFVFRGEADSKIQDAIVEYPDRIVLVDGAGFVPAFTAILKERARTLSTT